MQSFVVLPSRSHHAKSRNRAGQARCGFFTLCGCAAALREGTRSQTSRIYAHLTFFNDSLRFCRATSPSRRDAASTADFTASDRIDEAPVSIVRYLTLIRYAQFVVPACGMTVCVAFHCCRSRNGLLLTFSQLCLIHASCCLTFTAACAAVRRCFV